MENTCNHPANDLIEAVAFGYASEDEVQLVLEHAADCDVCAAALNDGRLAAQALPLTVTEMEPPASLWSGIEERIAVDGVSEKSTLSSPAQTPAPTLPRMYWAAAAMLTVLALVGGILLGRTVFEPGSESQSPPVADVSVTDPSITAHGTVEYLADQGVILLDLQNLPDAPEGFVYQVWMIQGDSPVSMGVFNPETSRFAVASDPVQYDLLAITLEEGPIGSDQPTSDPIVVAELEPLRGE